MRPLPSDGVTLSCRHADVWPPAPAYTGADPLEVRAERGDDAMTRYITWQRDCGILRMDPSKCRACPHVFIDGVPAGPVGGGSTAPPFMRRTRVRRS
jgi:hypothetical protein